MWEDHAIQYCLYNQLLRSDPAPITYVTPVQMVVTSSDPSFPWRKGLSGYPQLVLVPTITTLRQSATWVHTSYGRELKKKVSQTNKAQHKPVRRRDFVDKFLSVDAVAAIVARYQVPGTVVLAAWDPLGVASAAAAQQGQHCLFFLGLKVNTTVKDIFSKGDFPLPKIKTNSKRKMRHVVSFSSKVATAKGHVDSIDTDGERSNAEDYAMNLTPDARPPKRRIHANELRCSPRTVADRKTPIGKSSSRRSCRKM